MDATPQRQLGSAAPALMAGSRAGWHSFALGVALAAPISLRAAADDVADGFESSPVRLLLASRLDPKPLATPSLAATPQTDEFAALRLRLDHDMNHPAPRTLAPMPATFPLPLPRGPQMPRLPPGPDEPLVAILLEVRLNRQEPGESVLLLQERGGGVLVGAEDLKRWRLTAPQDAPVLRDGIAYHRLDAFAGSSYRLDAQRQRLDVELDAARLAPTYLLGSPLETPAPNVSPGGGFVNFDLSAGNDNGVKQFAGVVELGAFGAWGNGTSSFLGNYLQGSPGRVVRLDSTVTRDFPASLESVRLGDAIGGAGSWARAVRLGGVQWASNFAVQPGFIAFPLPGMSGVAALPSTVDYYVNDALRFRRDVPSGPFSIQELPVLTGQGEARLVVRDVLGREQVVSQRFYASTQLLRQGLQAFSYEAGFLRNDFGVTSNAYGPAAAIGTHRVGLTDRLTGELHAEVLRRQQTAGLGAAFLQPEAGVLSAAVAASRSEVGNGALGSLGFNRQGNTFSFGGSSQRASPGFVQLGYVAASPQPKLVTTAFASVSTVGAGALAISYTAQRWREQPDVKLVSANYSRQLGTFGALGVSLLRILGAQSSTIISANLSVPLSGSRSASASKTIQPGFSGTTVQLQQNVPTGSGVGYRLLADSAAGGRQQGSVTVQGDSGTASLEAAHADQHIALSANLSGGVAFIGGSAFAARRINDSFAVVDVPGHAGVRIFSENQHVATTNASGRALVSNLRAYETNHLRIDGADLPMDVSIDSVLVDAVPYARSGLLLRFPVRRSDGGTIRVLLDDGAELPAGALAQIRGHELQMPAGQRGEIYLTGLAAENQVSISWRGRQCDLSVSFVPGADPLPDLGTFICKGVSR